MTDDYPAQPAQPVKPEELASVNGGGWTGPQQSGPGYTGPIPGGVLPASGPARTGPPPESFSVPPPSVGAPAMQNAGPLANDMGLPPAAQALGLDAQTYENLMRDLRSSPDPEVFKTQFQQLMEQRAAIAQPQGTDSRGYQVPSEDLEKYYTKWVREAIAYGTTPKDFGGLGYTDGQARMMTIAQARKNWPNVAPSTWARMLPSKDLSAADLGHVKLGDKQPPIEVSPQRASRLDPGKVADILTKPEFKKAIDRAKTYKARVGNAANAVGFVQDVYNSEVARSKTAAAGVLEVQGKMQRYTKYAQDKAAGIATQVGADLDTAKQSLAAATQARAAGNEDAAKQALASIPKPLLEYFRASDKEFASLNEQLVHAKREAKNIGDEATILSEISNQAEILSVAAAISNLY